MLNFFKQKPKGSILEFEIDGMHCTSCSMSVDGELEDLDGVYNASTSYAKQKCIVEYDPKKINTDKIKSTVENLGYKIK
jgi:copper chaperone CopZ